MSEATTSKKTSAIVWPTRRYRDAPAAIRFLVDAFGFVEAAVYAGEDPGTIAHAELAWPAGGAIMLGSARPDTAIKDLAAGVGSVYVVTDDVDALFARARAAGARVEREPRDEDYGGRDFVVRDPEGVYWSFGTYAGQ